MAKVDLGFEKRTANRNKNKSTKSTTVNEKIEANKNTGNGLIDGLLPKEAPMPQRAPQRTKYLNYDLLYPSELNKDLSMDDIENLAELILCGGVQQPIGVIQDQEGRYKIISGHRRYEAITLLKKRGQWGDKVECKVFNLDDVNLFVSDDTENIDVPDDIKIKYLWLSANTGNRNIKLKDRLIMLQKAQEIYEDLKSSGATKYTIAGVDYEFNNLRDYVTRATGFSSGDFSRLRTILTKASDELMDAINNNEVSIMEALNIVSIDKDMQKDVLEKLLLSKHTGDTENIGEIESKAEDEQGEEVNSGSQDSESADTSYMPNLTSKRFNKDIRPIKKIVKGGINLSDEDMDEYNRCVQKILEIIGKY